MPRIRAIKPEFWDSPSVAKAGPWARLLFIAMWNWADDFGRGTANLKELEGFAFPNDDHFTDRSGNTVHFRDVVAEVSECFDVAFYSVDGRQFYEIPTWDKHQRNERRAKASKYPLARHDAAVAEIPCIRTEAPNISGLGTGEQGNRGTGEQGNSFSCSSDADASSKRPSIDDDFVDWWEHYPRKVGKGQAIKAYRRARKLADHDTLVAAIIQQAETLTARGKEFTPYPATWLNGQRWEDAPDLDQPEADDWAPPPITPRDLYGGTDEDYRIYVESMRR